MLLWDASLRWLKARQIGTNRKGKLIAVITMCTIKVTNQKRQEGLRIIQQLLFVSLIYLIVDIVRACMYSMCNN